MEGSNRRRVGRRSGGGRGLAVIPFPATAGEARGAAIGGYPLSQYPPKPGVSSPESVTPASPRAVRISGGDPAGGAPEEVPARAG